jgi:hypothetical protein
LFGKARAQFVGLEIVQSADPSAGEYAQVFWYFDSETGGFGEEEKACVFGHQIEQFV